MPLIALEVFLGFGVPVCWGAWELLSLRRERRRDALSAAVSEPHQAAAPGLDVDAARPGPPP